MTSVFSLNIVQHWFESLSAVLLYLASMAVAAVIVPNRTVSVFAHQHNTVELQHGRKDNVLTKHLILCIKLVG